MKELLVTPKTKVPLLQYHGYLSRALIIVTHRVGALDSLTQLWRTSDCSLSSAACRTPSHTMRATAYEVSSQVNFSLIPPSPESKE